MLLLFSVDRMKEVSIVDKKLFFFWWLQSFIYFFNFISLLYYLLCVHAMDKELHRSHGLSAGDLSGLTRSFSDSFPGHILALAYQFPL